MGSRKALRFVPALSLGLAFPLAVRVVFAAVERVDLFLILFEDWHGFAFHVVIVAVPFVMLTLYGVHAWQAWLAGTAITAIVSGYFLYQGLTYRGGGADLFLGLVILVSPLVVLGGALLAHSWARKIARPSER
jgi:hypothetical protein